MSPCAFVLASKMLSGALVLPPKRLPRKSCPDLHPAVFQGFLGWSHLSGAVLLQTVFHAHMGYVCIAVSG